MNTPTENREHLYDLLKDFDTAMLVTRSPDGRTHARPMNVAEMNADADAYFVTSIDSPKVAEIEANPAVIITFQSSSQYASVSGHATLVRDQALIDSLWSEAWKVWFPKGKTDPAILLIKFDAEDGEYWDNAGKEGLKYAFEAAKAYAKGETLKPDENQHARVNL